LRIDVPNGGVYQAKKFGNPVRDIDFTIPTVPSEQPRPKDSAPEQHIYNKNPTVGTMQRSKVGLPFTIPCLDL
jgi:hypothetical protein